MKFLFHEGNRLYHNDTDIYSCYQNPQCIHPQKRQQADESRFLSLRRGFATGYWKEQSLVDAAYLKEPNSTFHPDRTG